MAERPIRVQGAGEAPSVPLGPNRVTFLRRGANTGGRYSLTEFALAPPPAPAAPLHRHLDADELCYVLAGTLRVHQEGEETTDLAPGGSVMVPMGVWHTVSNPGPGEARILVVLTPPGFEGYWEAASRLLSESGGQPGPEAMLALQRRYHMEAGGKARRFTDEG